MAHRAVVIVVVASLVGISACTRSFHHRKYENRNNPNYSENHAGGSGSTSVLVETPLSTDLLKAREEIALGVTTGELKLHSDRAHKYLVDALKYTEMDGKPTTATGRCYVVMANITLAPKLSESAESERLERAFKEVRQAREILESSVPRPLYPSGVIIPDNTLLPMNLSLLYVYGAYIDLHRRKPADKRFGSTQDALNNLAKLRDCVSGQADRGRYTTGFEFTITDQLLSEGKNVQAQKVADLALKDFEDLQRSGKDFLVPDVSLWLKVGQNLIKLGRKKLGLRIWQDGLSRAEKAGLTGLADYKEMKKEAMRMSKELR